MAVNRRCAAGRRPSPSVALGHRRRGVVLIFVVAVLVLLVILSTAFYSTIRSQSLLQANRRTAMQAELAAQSGLNQAARHLHALNNPAVLPEENTIVGFPSDNTAGNFSRGDGWLQNASGQWLRIDSLYELDAATGARIEVHPPNTFRQYELDEKDNLGVPVPWPGPLDPTTFRWSWANFWVDDRDRTLRPVEPDAPLIQPYVRNMTDTDDILVWPYFPGVSLEHSQVPGELESLTASWSRGRRWVVTPNQVLRLDRTPYPADADFFGGDTTLSTYNPNFRHTLRVQQVQNPGYPLELTGAENPLSPPVTFSGYIDYRMTATDLDSRLYLPITRWIPTPLAGSVNDRLDATKGYGVANRKLILKTLNDGVALQIGGSAWTGNAWVAAVSDGFAVDDGSGRLDTARGWGDLWNLAADLDPTMDVAMLPPGDLAARRAFLFRKYLVPREINCYPSRFQPDLAHAGDDLGRPSAVERRPALNINTAPREVLAANFSAALLNEDSVATTLGSLTPDDLAVRILRCRPFYSRIDWEDFLAANLEEVAFANVYGNIGVRVIDATAVGDNGGVKGVFDASNVPAIPAVQTTAGAGKRMQWFRDQIAATSAARFTLKGFNTLLNAGSNFTGRSYFSPLAAIAYTEDTANPGNPLTTTFNWTEAGVAKSRTIAQAAAGSWTLGAANHMTEWNLTDDPTLRPAWDTAGIEKYLVPTGGELPDAWGGLDHNQPVIVAMPIKLRSHLFEVIARGQYIQEIDKVYRVRASHKIHAVYDTLNKQFWMQRNLVSEKGALSDP